MASVDIPPHVADKVLNHQVLRSFRSQCHELSAIIPDSYGTALRHEMSLRL